MAITTDLLLAQTRLQLGRTGLTPPNGQAPAGAETAKPGAQQAKSPTQAPAAQNPPKNPQMAAAAQEAQNRIRQLHFQIEALQRQQEKLEIQYKDLLKRFTNKKKESTDEPPGPLGLRRDDNTHQMQQRLTGLQMTMNAIQSQIAGLYQIIAQTGLSSGVGGQGLPNFGVLDVTG